MDADELARMRAENTRRLDMLAAMYYGHTKGEVHSPEGVL